MKKSGLFAITVLIISNLCFASGEPIFINPVNDGTVGTGGIDTSTYVSPFRQIWGIIKFSTVQIDKPIEEAFISVNPYAKPLFCPLLDVFAYECDDSSISLADYDYYFGSYIGSLYLPENLGFGQDAFLDITEFMQGVSKQYVGFSLRSTNGMSDVLSSLEHNYGHPSQLIIIPVPEPMTILLLSVGGLMLMKKAK